MKSTFGVCGIYQAFTGICHIYIYIMNSLNKNNLVSHCEISCESIWMAKTSKKLLFDYRNALE